MTQKQCTESKTGLGALVHTQLTQVACSVLRPRAQRRVVARSGAVSWRTVAPCRRLRPCVSWSCHSCGRPYHGRDAHASCAYRRPPPGHDSKSISQPRPLPRAVSQPWLCCIATKPAAIPSAPLSRYNQLYCDMPMTRLPACHDTMTVS